MSVSSVQSLTAQLSTGSQNIITSALSHDCGKVFFDKNILEPEHALLGGGQHRYPFVRVERDEVYLGSNSRKQFREVLSVLILVIYSFDQDIFKSDSLSLLKRECPACFKEFP